VPAEAFLRLPRNRVLPASGLGAGRLPSRQV